MKQSGVVRNMLFAGRHYSLLSTSETNRSIYNSTALDIRRDSRGRKAGSVCINAIIFASRRRKVFRRNSSPPPLRLATAGGWGGGIPGRIIETNTC